MSSHWETVIGLEIHTQLATKSKIFSAAATEYGAEPNTQACAVDLGLPGVLPVLNAEAVNMAIKFGLAIDAEIAPSSVFARKNYFYRSARSRRDRAAVVRPTLDVCRSHGARSGGGNRVGGAG